MSDFKVEEADLYELLGVESTCTTSEIKKAYRKKALDCHPDKNPDDPNAANLFHQLSKVLEILSDDKARRAYDKVLDARKSARLRHRELDSHRKKLKEDLELREKQSASYRTKTNDELLKAEIDRLRKEGSNHLKEEMEYVNNLVKNSKRQCESKEWESSKHRIKIKWQVDKNSSANGGYTQELLHKCLSKYGDIHVLVMSPQRKGSALVEYKTRQGAEMAVLLEKGISKNPLILKWVNGPPQQSGGKNTDSLVKETDLESLVFHKMRQAAERKRLIEQMEAEDKE